MNIQKIRASPHFSLYEIRRAEVNRSGNYLHIAIDGEYPKENRGVRCSFNLPENDGGTKKLLTRLTGSERPNPEEIATMLEGSTYFDIKPSASDAWGRWRTELREQTENPNRLHPDYVREGLIISHQGKSLGVSGFLSDLDEHYPLRPHRSFREEKGFRAYFGQNRIYPWKTAEGTAEAGVRATVRAINRLPFAFSYGWSHSNLPSDHGAESYRGYGHDAYASDHTGYVVFRADATHKGFQALRRNVAEAGGSIDVLENHGNKHTYRGQPYHILRMPLETPPANEYTKDDEGRMKSAWRKVNQAIRKTRSGITQLPGRV